MRSPQSRLPQPRPSAAPAQIKNCDVNEIEESPFYHGRLPLSDLPALLTQEGDFLIRQAKVDLNKDDNKALAYVITTKDAAASEGVVSPGGVSRLGFRNIQIQERYGKWQVDTHSRHATLLGLIEHYRTTNIVIKEKSLRLGRGIRRAPVAIHNADVCDRGNVLLHGQFTDATTAKLKLTGGKMADVVLIKPRGCSMATRQRGSELMNMGTVMRYLEHPNIVKVYGMLDPPSSESKKDTVPTIVLENFPGRTLEAYLVANAGDLDIDDKMKICLHLSLAVEYLHEERRVVGELAARCARIGDGCAVKLAEFGSAHIGVNLVPAVQESAHRSMAPEVLRDGKMSYASDIYGLAMLCYEVFTDGAAPFTGTPLKEIKQKVLSGARPTIPRAVPLKVRDFVATMWDHDPTRRPDIKKVVAFIRESMTPSKEEASAGKMEISVAVAAH